MQASPAMGLICDLPCQFLYLEKYGHRMRYTLTILLALLTVFLAGPGCIAQSDFRVSDPQLELRGKRILISYDILNSSDTDRFNIAIDIRDSAGNLISAHTLEGDIGKSVPGGGNKEIYWDFQADRIEMNGDIYVNVSAEILPPGAAVAAGSSGGTASSGFSRTGLVVQSLALPGLGLSRIKQKPHWIKGVAGYGCIAGAVIMNRSAVSTYEEFQSSQDVEDADALLQKAGRQDNLSEAFGYTALAIWVSDLVWTLLATPDDKKGAGSGKAAGLSLDSGIDDLSKYPMIGLVYRF
jgi:hypothetical protein